MNTDLTICKIKTKEQQDESIILDSLKIVSTVKPFSLSFTQDKTNIILKPNGIFLSYMYYDKKTVINSLHNKVSFSKNNRHFIFDTSQQCDTFKLNYRITSKNNKIKIFYSKNNNNIITYDTTSPYEYKSIGKDMLYYRVKIFNDFKVVYNFYCFKVIYYIAGLAIYEIIYKNNKIIINIVDNSLKNFYFDHKTLYHDPNIHDKNRHYKKMWINRSKNYCTYQIIKNNNQYDLTVTYDNNKRDFKLYKEDGKVHLIDKNSNSQTYKNLKFLLFYLNVNFYYFFEDISTNATNQVSTCMTDFQ